MKPLKDSINITVLPPGTEVNPHADCSVNFNAFGIISSAKPDMYLMKLERNREGEILLVFFPSPGDTREYKYDNAQDAWDAGIAMLLTGAVTWK